MNSVFGLIHLLGERLETRGLWVEFKKKQLESMPMLDFRNVDLTDKENEQLENVMKNELTRFDEYLKYMANIERNSGDWLSALKKVISENNKYKARAVLDDITYSMLKRTYSTLNPPKKLYELLFNEIKVLQKIMEPREIGKSVIRDRGYTRMRIAQRSIKEWITRT